MIGAISTALSGMTAATRRADEAATSIVNAGTGEAAAASDNYAEGIVALKTAETAFKANVAVLKTADDMQKRLLDTFA